MEIPELTNENFLQFITDAQYGVIIVMEEVTPEYDNILNEIHSAYEQVSVAVTSCEYAFHVGIPSIPGALLYRNSDMIARVMDEDIPSLKEIVSSLLLNH